MVNATSYAKVAKLGSLESVTENIIIKPQKHQDYWSAQVQIQSSSVMLVRIS